MLETLRKLADHVFNSLQICALDDAQLLPDTEMVRAAAMQRFYALQKLFDAKISLPGRGIVSDQTPWRSAGVGPFSKAMQSLTDGVSGGPPPLVPETPEPDNDVLSEDILEQYFYLVDQITATIARLAVLGRDSDYWHVVVLACLAKMSVKMKFLADNLHRNIETAVVMCKRWFQDYRFSSRPDDNAIRHADIILDDSSPTSHRYCQENETVSRWLADCFERVLKGIGSQKPWWMKGNNFDVTAIVYPVGLEATRTLVSQDARGEISGTSQILPLSFASGALELVRDLSISFIDLKRDSINPSPNATSFPQAISMHLTVEFSGAEKPETKCDNLTYQLRKISDLVALSTSLSLTHALIGRGFERSLQTISSLSAFAKVDQPIAEFHAFVTLKTMPNKPSPDSRYSLSTSILASIRHDPFTRNQLCTNIPKQPAKEYMQNPSSNVTQKRDHLRNLTTQWAIQENSITIGCATYVNAILATSILLVIGGLSCGFAVGEKIPGVDPFNLTMFSWITGGFMILVAKSIRVSDWTWRDFLLRRVTCRTVNEVCDVTGLDGQDVLAFLLSSEAQSTLRPSGPFRGSFIRQGDYDGFSIDIKPNLQTLLAAGIIPIIVLGLSGPALIFLRLTPGFSGTDSVDVIGNFRYPGTRLCADPPLSGEDRDALIVQGPLSWIKVLGVYDQVGVMFR